MNVVRKWIALIFVAGAVALGLWLGLAPDAEEGPAPQPVIPTEEAVQAPPPPLPAGMPYPIDEPPPATTATCSDPKFTDAAFANAHNLTRLAWAPFRRPEIGWETYAPLIAQEIGTACAPGAEGFAAALARWQGLRGFAATGLMDEKTFAEMRAAWYAKRPFARRQGECPDPPQQAFLVASRPEEGYGGKAIELRYDAFEAYRRMAKAARAEDPRIAADPRFLTIFSGYRSPESDAERCARDGNCDGIVRAVCSPHRTGLAMDLYVGQAPGFEPDSSADPNRLAMTKTPAYLWLVRNARRFGFAPYPFEPWHWEWTGAPG